MSKKSSKSTVGPSKFSRPYITAAANGVQDAFGANAPNVAALSAGLNAQLPGITTNTLNNPTIGAASGYDQSVLSGKYLGEGNPYLDKMISSTNDDVQNRVLGSLGSFGRFGGDAQSQILARELSKSENALRYSDYSGERDRMGQAAAGAGGLASAQNQGLAAYLATLQQAADLPVSNATGMAQSLGALLGNYNTTSTKKSGLDNYFSFLNAASSAAQAAGGGA